MKKTLHIDWTACDGRGVCTELLPSLLERDDWGYPLVREPVGGDRSTAEIGPQEADAAVDAVRLCPRLALRLGTGTSREQPRRRGDG